MMKLTIEHNNKIYNFENGYEAYIFCAAVNNEFDKTHSTELKDFVVLVGECYLKDSTMPFIIPESSFERALKIPSSPSPK